MEDDRFLFKTANQRGVARLFAVQALYQMDIGRYGVLEVIAEYEKYRFGQEIDGDIYLKADTGWFRKIMHGVVNNQKKIDSLVTSSLAEGWSLSRLDLIIRAILRAGCFELLECTTIPAAVVISEYVEIAHAFFNKEEPKFVNAVLDKISCTLALKE
ncbi:Transcription termination protein NusB [Liberibacter crescens BT-1]|uniref:Transcription antitermination protein NusB n=1 Tax=Liberibacter crescens (strain BT-1) TaxID=1215343 RepID=L0EXI3_LIBCB|nr:transcription antitermination factor NusB [Liberibacter crescens]AGA65076.1 Transcription termination protein NusB [Liberibacter crescens BT-1]AMC13064.1 antitermination protein NusB [Liberibacter crescens]